MDSDSDFELESKVISLITQLMCLNDTTNSLSDTTMKLISFIAQIMSLVSSIDLDSKPRPKPESEVMSLVTQIISLCNSMDLDSQPKPLSELISLISQNISLVDFDYDSKPRPKSSVRSLFSQTLSLKPEPELISLIHQIISLVISMTYKSMKLISLCPQAEVTLEERKFHVKEEVLRRSSFKWNCLPHNWEKFRLGGEDVIHFFCRSCKGKNHEEYEKTPVKIKHPLHPKHSLQLVLLDWQSTTRKCYCCDEDLIRLFYNCTAFDDYAMNISCVDKSPVLALDHPKWHKHTLALFPRQAFLTCNVCALADSSSPIYMCPPCDFVVHKRCTSLPRVIRISRHPHRISFTHSFDHGDWCCGVCRRKIDNDYGGFSCIKEGCSYAAHSKCATQRNVWDGKDLEGEKEDIEEEVLEPFARISDGIIQHFSHEHHHLRLDNNTDRDYDDNKECQACITPIYFGNFYSCMQCDYILHEACANLSRKIHHPIHPHLLTLLTNDVGGRENFCSACPSPCTAGFYYACRKKESDDFQLHVQCGTISEPLVHESHMHPLFLTSKPGEGRRCSICKYPEEPYTETFNCIECDFALCFGCATLPQKVRYKHDKHILTLFHGDETRIMTYWCEVCERKIHPVEQFYMCDEYCCVNLHTRCLLGNDLYTKLGSSWSDMGRVISVLPNNQHMSRPVCTSCKERCPQKIVFQQSGLIFCCLFCLES